MLPNNPVHRTYLYIIFSLLLAVGLAETSLFFKTEPTVERKSVTVVTKDEDGIDKGLIFVSRFGRGPPGIDIHGWGPEIFDSDGNLIWCGRLDVDVWYAKRFQVCNYPGSYSNRHLCFHQSVTDYALWHPGFLSFLDESYFLVSQFGRVGNSSLDWPEGHEINTPSSCSQCLLQVIFQPKKIKITDQGKTEEFEVRDGCFQEVDMLKRTATFEWCALDHLPEEDLRRFVTANPKHVHEAQNPVDLWHLNGVDRNEDGDYLISLRWLDNVLKIAGKNSANPGSILWRLGPTGDFAEDFIFAGQHTARFVNSTENTETISFFNNALQRKPHDPVAKFSSGFLVRIDHDQKAATLQKSFDSPENEISVSRGNMQMLPNGNAFVGWGERPRYTEFAPDGRIVLDVTFDKGASQQAWKQEWVGRPSTTPKVVAYALRCVRAPLYAYVSWNGATEVAQWRFLATDKKSHYKPHSWQTMGTVKRDGFETQAKLSDKFMKFVYVEALDSSGEIIGTSPVVQTFVPKAPQMSSCTETECLQPKSFEYSEVDSKWEKCVYGSPKKGHSGKNGNANKGKNNKHNQTSQYENNDQGGKQKHKGTNQNGADISLLKYSLPAFVLVAFIEATTWLLRILVGLLAYHIN